LAAHKQQKISYAPKRKASWTDTQQQMEARREKLSLEAAAAAAKHSSNTRRPADRTQEHKELLERQARRQPQKEILSSWS
jgi:hypothetical protein